MVPARSAQEYLVELLRARWSSPPVALWRAVELSAAAQESYARPLMDLGCGDGLVARILFGPVGVDVGVDPWGDQVARAARSGAYRWVQQADGRNLPYADGTFATVFSNSVLEHIADLPPVIRDIGRVLRGPDSAEGGPAGRFIITVPSDAFSQFLHFYQARLEAGDRAGAERYVEEVDARLAHYHYHTPEEWAEILAEGGMVVEKARYYMPEAVERHWDRMNARFGISGWSLWRWLASPRLRGLGYQGLLRRLVGSVLARAWRPYCEMKVPPDQKGGGLLVIARKVD